MRLRAIAARLQAAYIPPLRLLPFGGTTSTASRVLSPLTGARSAGCRWHPRVWPAGPKGVHGRDLAHISIYMEIASFCEPLPLQSAALTASPKGTPSRPRARGRGTAKRWKRSLDGRGRTIPDSKSSQASQPRARARSEAPPLGGLRRSGMPVASPGVARRAERGPSTYLNGLFRPGRRAAAVFLPLSWPSSLPGG